MKAHPTMHHFRGKKIPPHIHPSVHPPRYTFLNLHGPSPYTIGEPFTPSPSPPPSKIPNLNHPLSPLPSPIDTPLLTTTNTLFPPPPSQKLIPLITPSSPLPPLTHPLEQDIDDDVLLSVVHPQKPK